MKPLSDVIHRTPWWALLLGGLIAFVGLAAFVTPYHIIDYRRDAASPEEKTAIKREIDNAFADNAIDIGRSVILGMKGATSDPARRDELDQALESLDEARRELREVGREALRAKRDAAREARQAAREAAAAVREAQRDVQQALKEGGLADSEVSKSLEQSLAAAQKAEDDARRALEEAEQAAAAPPPEPTAQITEEKGKRRIVIRGPGKGDRPMVDIDLGEMPAPPAPPALPDGSAAAAPPAAPATVLPPELRTRIRRDVTHDLYRMGLGAGLMLILIPLFILAVVAKFFIDRSRAALRMAELKRKEAEYSRMSQQVTEAKLSALQAQVEPHFLYNTLASVQALTEVDPARASAMTGHLIQYLRNALPKMRESVSTVGQEVELVRAYLNILQMRMGKRLAFTIDVPPELADAPFPPLMLPSLVENAIKHGLEPQREGGEVRIRAEGADGRLRMIVSDTGRGFSDTPGAGVGLANIRERLAAMYGGEARLTLEANTPQGVVATIEVPRRGADAAAPGAASPGAAAPAAPPGAPEQPRSAARRTLAAMGTAERAWRKGLSFAFVVMVTIAAIVSGLAIVGVATGAIPAQFGDVPLEGPTGTLLGTAGIAAGFAAVVLALAIVVAVLYGLGFVFVGIAIFVPIAVLVSLFPLVAPFALVGLGIWWLVRRGRRREAERAAAMAAPAPPAAPPAP
jgi:histidine kinase/histidine kinase/DNA gyrase B/HSP90-like ATPase